jgi:hypothetical protein
VDVAAETQQRVSWRKSDSMPTAGSGENLKLASIKSGFTNSGGVSQAFEMRARRLVPALVFPPLHQPVGTAPSVWRRLRCMLDGRFPEGIYWRALERDDRPEFYPEESSIPTRRAI